MAPRRCSKVCRKKLRLLVLTLARLKKRRLRPLLSKRLHLLRKKRQQPQRLKKLQQKKLRLNQRIDFTELKRLAASVGRFISHLSSTFPMVGCASFIKTRDQGNG